MVNKFRTVLDQLIAVSRDDIPQAVFVACNEAEKTGAP